MFSCIRWMKSVPCPSRPMNRSFILSFNTHLLRKPTQLVYDNPEIVI